MSKYGYEAFEDEQIEEILENIKDGFYEVLECKYGDYNLSILKEREEIFIHLVDEFGESSNSCNIESFINLIKNKKLEKYIDETLYYNYTSYERE